jgi:hypothetical protein
MSSQIATWLFIYDAMAPLIAHGAQEDEGKMDSQHPGLQSQSCAIGI